MLLLQEYTEHWHEAFQAGLGPAYPHIAFVMEEDPSGSAIYSKSPFEEPVELYVPLGEGKAPQLRAVFRKP